MSPADIGAIRIRNPRGDSHAEAAARQLGSPHHSDRLRSLGPIGGSGWTYAWGHQDDEQSIRAIQHALERGINWIDTAAVYGLGHSDFQEPKLSRNLALVELLKKIGERHGRAPSEIAIAWTLRRPVVTGEWGRGERFLEDSNLRPSDS
ncbi:aldo/keto reductase [Archangium violaceum]|uniref:aldo/keto reductase n=1 Tax=Archangium violaceum TaxID=83451 RepID=UPI001EEFDEBB|nr:aldo/keto reductase [Archangium violaceum]